MAQPAQDLDALLREAESAIAAADSQQALNEARARFLGKKGSVSAVLRGIGGLDGEARARVGKDVNRVKGAIEAAVTARREGLASSARDRDLAEHRLDVTLPASAPRAGRLHPVSRMEAELCRYFQQLGYDVEDGPEVETDHNNFGALNFPEDHPARDLQDTFFVEGGHVLRTHTSNVQIRAMTGKQPPFRFIAPGRVFRHDLDATHFPMFHQMEAVCVGESVSFADLKGSLCGFARYLFGDDVKMRFRAHYFPFTEPSAEMDVWWQGRWLEIMGSGMIHPRVLANCGIDPERWQGFAFGFSIDRPAMIRFGVPNIRQLFEGDVRILEQL
ncbi:MAG: phenylalanine--tRNA ligase subunit alpha [Myxococcota bacterium]|nr:phenylalanine--tRNA ligase subunit alpha [Myxococcota bacterium]